MGDLVVLFVILVLSAAVVLGPLGLFTLGLAAVAAFDGNGLVRPEPRPLRRSQPAPGSLTTDVAIDASLTTGPASRMSSFTPSA